MADENLKETLEKLKQLLGKTNFTSDPNKEGTVFEIIWDHIGICHLRLFMKSNYHYFGWGYSNTVYYYDNSRKGQNIRYYESDFSIVSPHNVFNHVVWLAVANKIAGRAGIRIACGGPEDT